ncbi:MAG: prolyl-tRNA synthetase, partial [Patescibacteria group bacterium]
MLLSKLLYKTQKNLPADEVSLNAKLLIQACYIRKEAAGIYSFLPLGLKVLNKIENIIREEINTVGGQEILMNGLTPKQNWVQTNR